jgi:hypothetical protein
VELELGGQAAPDLGYAEYRWRCRIVVDGPGFDMAFHDRVRDLLSMKRMAWLAWLLAGLMFALTPMAWASPIDPSWINGVYDDGDFDDVVIYLTSGAIAIPELPVNDLLPPLAFVSADPVRDARFAGAPPPASYSPRAPPLS